MNLNIKTPTSWTFSNSDSALTPLELVAIMLSYIDTLKRNSNRRMFRFIMNSLHTFKRILNNSNLLGALDANKNRTPKEEAILRVLTSFDDDRYPSVEHFVAHVQMVFVEFSNLVDLNAMIDHIVKQTDDPVLSHKQVTKCPSCKDAEIELKNGLF